ncbi:ATP-binding protein [Litoribrevibacter albus]|uniref:histidine kinase n=1 Tax=Litoribrevibacter albus TaxID=1473156 RepID=A0AA37SDA9_9GAMM|nr:ATP-binding protein [Litoribrevibacter albus]GLQ32963.1 hypothetical protein GCM10007876_34420 [Litoribrevibacter albus]
MKRFNFINFWFFILFTVTLWLSVIFIRISNEVHQYSDQVNDNRPWHLSQFQLEIERLNSALIEYVYQSTDENRAKVIFKLELLWNRTDILVGGVAGQELKRYDQTSYRYLRNIQSYLSSHEDELYQMTPAYAAQFHSVNLAWADEYKHRIREIFQRSYQNFHEVSQQVLDTYYLTRILILSLGLVIFVLTWVLYREFQRSKRLRITAEKASEAKSLFLANMSHEIRTPLNGIIGSIQLMRTSEDISECKDLMKTLEQSSEALLAQINDVLDYSRMESERHVVEQVPFDVVSLVRSVTSIYNAQAKNKQLTLTFNVEHQVDENEPLTLVVLGDPNKLRQVLLNLISNAIKFTQEGSVSVTLKVTNDNLIIAVTDTGIGIAEDKHEAIFHPFGQEDSSISRRFGGSGLGLAISKKLAEVLGGELTVKSQVAQGSTFTLSIPYIPARAGETYQISEDLVQEPMLLKGKVLLVEDNPVNQKIANAMLKKLGLQVTLASNGDEAVKAVAIDHFDLILMDLQMPEKDGLQATQEIRALGHTMPIIALTANSTIESQQSCFEVGMVGFISKPFKVESLYQALQMHLGQFA